MNYPKLSGKIVFLYRNNSTNRPTLKHIINSKGNAYCGWKDDTYAELHVLGDVPEIDCCKKCLKAYKKSKK